MLVDQIRREVIDPTADTDLFLHPGPIFDPEPPADLPGGYIEGPKAQGDPTHCI